MRLLEILKNNEELFLVDDIEDKKTKIAVKEVNDLLKNVYTKYMDFLTFADNQLHGEYNKKLVNLKSLQRQYGEWNGIKQAFIGAFKEEENKINELYSMKATLINKLKALVTDSQKLLPILSKYHLYNGHLEISSSEHETIILGSHNTNVLSDIIEELEKDIIVQGNFSEVESIELTANYSIVNSNVELCRNKIEDFFSNKQSKADKLYFLVENMEIAAKSLVFFETYKQTMLDVGCPNKDVDLYEKDLLKKYVPFKKQLQKALKINFEDISSIVVNEEDYVTSYFEKVTPFESTNTEETYNDFDPFAESFDLEGTSTNTEIKEEPVVTENITPDNENPYEMFQLTPSENEIPQEDLSNEGDVFEDLFEESSSGVQSEPIVQQTPVEEKPKKVKTTKPKKKVEETPTPTSSEEDLFDFYKNEQNKDE